MRTLHQLGSTDYLRLLTANDWYLLLERGSPRGRLKKDFVSVKMPDGKDASGFTKTPVELPVEILNEFLAASLVEQDGPEHQGEVIYRLTDEGRRRGRS